MNNIRAFFGYNTACSDGVGIYRLTDKVNDPRQEATS